jgi:hypothetical protein
MSRALTAVPDSDAPRSSWEQLLLVSVRPEFRGEVIVAPTGSPLLGAGCAVTGCTGYGHYRPWGRGTGRALCALHGGPLAEGRASGDRWVGPARRPVASAAAGPGVLGSGLPAFGEVVGWLRGASLAA